MNSNFSKKLATMQNHSRIAKVFVEKLFGLFDHTIRFNLDEHLTIVHGPNGIGKTIILRMIADLMDGRLSLFRKVPFDKFRIDFEDGRAVAVHTEIAQGDQMALPFDDAPRQAMVTIYDADGHSSTYRSTDRVANHLPRTTIDRIETYLPFLSRISRATWRENRTGELLDLEDVLERHREDLPFSVSLLPSDPALATALRTFLTVRLIRTQRLDAEHRDVRGAAMRREALPAVERHSHALTTQIGHVREEYGAVSQRLDRDFPFRLAQQDTQSDLTVLELRTRFGQLETRRAELSELGLLDPDSGLAELPDAIIEKRRDVFSAYVRDVENKLAVFDDIASRIQTLRDIISSRFQYKTLRINRSRGYAFRSGTGKDLKPSDLSSGEQHELVLVHELVFNTQKRSLVLIDEPEISLHLAWQQQFLDDLRRIIHLSDFDVLIATHSADIIGPNWNLTVELKGPAQQPEGPNA